MISDVMKPICATTGEGQYFGTEGLDFGTKNQYFGTDGQYFLFTCIIVPNFKPLTVRRCLYPCFSILFCGEGLVFIRNASNHFLLRQLISLDL